MAANSLLDRGWGRPRAAVDPLEAAQILESERERTLARMAVDCATWHDAVVGRSRYGETRAARAGGRVKTHQVAYNTSPHWRAR
jgi:hypothetical protein